MQTSGDVGVVSEIMVRFARDSGLSPSNHAPQRYLWTDAFAVCNYLELFRRTGQQEYRRLAMDLVDQVHGVLGRHRKDDPRTGWISGLEEAEGRRHPTLGGLRIGKKLAERTPGQPGDDVLEWDRDGQYFHYLTKWMHALHQVGVVTTEPTYLLWAGELARTAHRAFAYRPSPGAPMRMYWKMSIDLRYPLVPSMGHHDPLDGLVTCLELDRAMARRANDAASFTLDREITELAEMCRGKDWTTDDPLGIGGLLFDAYRILQMKTDHGGLDDYGLLPVLLESARAGLEMFAARNSLGTDARSRLAFREAGLAIGLHAVAGMISLVTANGELDERGSIRRQLDRLAAYAPLAAAIEAFWLDPASRRSASWQAHENINMVMLATSLAPDGFLTLMRLAPPSSGEEDAVPE